MQMPVNQVLTDAVLAVMCSLLNKADPSFGDSTTDLGLARLRTETQLMVDERHKVRVHYRSLVGYGYDFRQTDEDGTPAIEGYRRAVANTKELKGKFREHFIAEGTIEDKIGWYITEMGFVQGGPVSSC